MTHTAPAENPSVRTTLLGDTTERDYSQKLRLFAAFAAPELDDAIESLELRPGMRVLDAGCGTCEVLARLTQRVGANGLAVGIDLARAHLGSGADTQGKRSLLVQADLEAVPFAPETFDLIWAANAINHVQTPVVAIRRLSRLLRKPGCFALAQSCFLPDMFFAWDSRLERLVNEAVRQYYRDRYRIDERELAGVRALVGQLRSAGLTNVRARTIVIERVSPLSGTDERYLQEVVFRDTWGERILRYLPTDDAAALKRLCDPHSTEYALRRPDFHFVQTLSLVTGECAT